jgi:Tfp pilus assembly protein PilV
MNTLKQSRGFLLIEVLIALVILSISLLAFAALMATTTRNNSSGNHLTEAATLAQDMLEQLRAMPYGMITPNTPATDTKVGKYTGISYTRSWVAVPNIPPPSDTLKVITITITWADRTPHSISIVSAIPQ